MKLPIVVAAFNRPAALSRLMVSLKKAEYPKPVKLIISIDGGGDDEVLKISKEFKWPFGEKLVIKHAENLGLRRHIISCGDLSADYDGLILFEDDLYVSPHFYNYARIAIDFYSRDKDIAGIALYTHSFNETAGFPFSPLLDGSDVFFIQLACSWGQCWTKGQWHLFKNWFNMKESLAANNKKPALPWDIASWPESSWKKHFITYMIEKNLFFVYPRTSYTTNFGDAGQHHKNVQHFQVPLQYGKKTPFFVKLCDSYAVFDAFCEMIPACFNRMVKELSQYDYCVDLNGTKRISEIKNKHMLTSQRTRQAIFSFGRKLSPIEANIIENIHGKRLVFTKTENCIDNGYSTLLKKKILNPKEKILYHYNIPEQYVNQLRIRPIKLFNGIFKKILIKQIKIIPMKAYGTFIYFKIIKNLIFKKFL